MRYKFSFFLIFTLLAGPSVCPAAWIKEKIPVKSGQSGLYRVYFLVSEGKAEERPEVGYGNFREMNYKVVFQDEWKPRKNLKVQVAFVDSKGFHIAKDILPDKKFAPFGETYGQLWVPEDSWRKIEGVEVKEITPRKKKEKHVPQVSEPEPPAEPEKPDNTPKGLFDYGKTVYTDEMIKKELESRRMTAPPDDSKKAEEEVTDDEPEPETGEAEIEAA